MIEQSDERADGGPVLQDADAAALSEFGYQQELPRVLKMWTNWAVGFAFVSPVVGLFTVFQLGLATAGVMWIWAVPVVVLFQGIVALSYGPLAARWPIAGGIYQWSKRLVGPRYGWWAGWYYIAALVLSASLTTYAGAIFLGHLLGIDPGPTKNHIFLALGLLSAITLVNVVGLKLLKVVVNFGVGAEIIASVIIGLILLFFFRVVPEERVITAAVPGGGASIPAMVAVIASTAWLIVGFDACGSVAEETKDAKRQVPRAMFLSVLAVGVIDILGAVAWTLAIPEGEYEGDPISSAVVNAFGGWAETPFLCVVLVSFIACGIATQGAATRVVWSFSRDGQIPGARVWRKVTAFNQSPTYAVLLVAVLSASAFLYANVLSVLVNFTAGAYYIGFLCPLAALLYHRLKKKWTDPIETPYSYGPAINTFLCAVGVTWLVFEIINISWPRASDLPWYENYGFFVGLGAWALIGGLYMWFAKPLQRTGSTAERVSVSEDRLG